MAELLRARDYQPPDDPFIAAAYDAEPELVEQLSSSFVDFKDQVDQGQLEDSLGKGEYAVLVAAIGFDRLRAMLADKLRSSLRLVYDAGAAAVPDLSASDAAPTDAAVEPEADQLAREIVAADEQSVSAAVQRGIAENLDLEDLAALIRDSIGLAPRQAVAVANYRRLLTEGDLSALDRVLRDRRYDRAFEAAVDAGRAFGAEQIDQAVDAYADRQLAYRARMIARTETLRLTNAGARSVYQSAVAQGRVPLSGVRRFWLISIDEKTCPVCRSIPLMNPEGVVLGQPYLSIVGPMMYPQDPHPFCRCTERYEVSLIQQTGAIAA